MKTTFPSFSPIFDKGTIYLVFLHFESEDLPEAIGFIRGACNASKDYLREIKALFAEVGWREHLLASAAMLTQENLPKETFAELWLAFDRGSWVSPQLAVTAWMRDPNFETSAQERIKKGCPQDTANIDRLSPLQRHVLTGPASNLERSAKALSALAYLLGLSETAKVWLAKELQREDLAQILSQDEDRGGEIAESWLASVRLKSKILNLQID